MTGKVQVTFPDKKSKYADGHRTVQLSFNCYHVEVKEWDRSTEGQKVIGGPLFKRGDEEQEEWLDDKHRKITDALNALEAAVLEALT